MNENLLPQTPVFKDWLDQASSLLIQSDILTAKLDSELILSDVINKPRTFIHAHPNDKLDIDSLKKANINLQRRINREPIAYITGVKEFYGREFFVTSDTLIPRPESELIIESLKGICATNFPKGADIIDVGAGSGILGITAKLEIPKLNVTLSDISQPALDIASKNAHSLHANVKIIKSDLLNNISAKFDIIIANLPYVDIVWERSRETNYEPASALFADEGGLSLIKNLLDSANNNLNHNGYIILESDPRQHDQITKYAESKGFKIIKEDDYIQTFKRLG